MSVTHYTAAARKDGRWWMVQCDQFPGAISQVARLDQAAAVVREAIAFVADVPEDEVEVEVRAVVSNLVRAELAEMRRLRDQARAADEAAAALHRRVAHELSDAGLSVRDIGVVLEVSHQRAHQLISS